MTGVAFMHSELLMNTLTGILTTISKKLRLYNHNS